MRGMKMLEKKVALVTGASRGIGREIAITLAAQGNFVVVNYNGSKEKAMEVVKTIEENGGQAAVYQCSVGDFNACQEMIQSIIKEYGRLDILVNNAGITRDNLIMKMKEEDFDTVINTNLKGAFNTIRHSARQMLKQRSGKIINISSVWGVAGASCEVAYSATKGGINAFTKALAKELGPSNIQVNAVACGAIDTEMNKWMSEDDLISLVDEIPAGRLGKAEEVADLVYHLAYKSSYLTGQVIGLDGGWI